MISPDSLADKISRLVGRYRKFSKLSADYAHDIADCVENNEAELLAALRSSASARLADIPTDALDVALHLRNAPNDVSPAIAIAAASYLERLWHAVSASAREVETIERCALLVRGVVYAEHYRAWPTLEVENRRNTDRVTVQCDALAAAILALAPPASPTTLAEPEAEGA